MNYEESSDSNDEDYLPEKKSDVSEVDSEGESEDDLLNDAELCSPSAKRKRRSAKSSKKLKTFHNRDIDNKSSTAKSPEITNEEQKKVEEDIWADFMRDTGFKSRRDTSVNVDTNKLKSAGDCKSKSKDKITEKVNETQNFNFARENVTLEKEVSKKSFNDKSLIPNQSVPRNSKSRSKSNGISGILNQLGKKSKINTLEKSKLDWDTFKKEENLEEELQTYNKGKNGYLEKQDFLNRADLRRFEIEKEIRTAERNKRVNI